MKVMRFLFRFLISLCIAIGLIILLLMASGNGHLIKAVRSTYLIGKTGPSINDHIRFENAVIKSRPGSEWPRSAHYNNYHLSKTEDSIVNSWETVAFLLIQNDSLLFEKYYEDYSRDSYSNSFSVAKSLVGLAIGAALEKGCIQSIDQKVGDFLEEYKEGERSRISIKDLLQMSSGIDFGESYGDPFGFMAKAYYGDEFYELTMEKNIQYPPSEVWKYQGGNTLLLSFILKEACGKSLSEFFSENIWSKIGASKSALWTINDEGFEKSYCCFYSNARDFARVGKLVLDSGQWAGKQLVQKDFVSFMQTAANIKDESGELVDHYGGHWWLTKYQGKKVVYARGILGQYIVIIPQDNLIMVRLGHRRDPAKGPKVPVDLYDYLKISNDIISQRGQ